MCIYILGAAAAAAVSSRRRIRGEIHTLSYLGTPARSFLVMYVFDILIDIPLLLFSLG